MQEFFRKIKQKEEKAGKKRSKMQVSAFFISKIIFSVTLVTNSLQIASIAETF